MCNDIERNDTCFGILIRTLISIPIKKKHDPLKISFPIHLTIIIRITVYFTAITRSVQLRKRSEM